MMTNFEVGLKPLNDAVLYIRYDGKTGEGIVRTVFIAVVCYYKERYA